MPQVPYNPVADVSPSGQGTPYFSDRGATPEAFGAGVGASVERFGAELGRTASTIESNVLATQQLKNEAEVNSATTADLLTSGKLTNDFRQLPGSQAQDALNDHVKSLQTEREKLRDSLSNPEAKRMFDQQTMHRFALDVVNSSNYAATQMKLHTKQTYADHEDAIVQDTAKRVKAGEPGALEKGVSDLINNNRAAGKLDDDTSPDALNKKNRTSLTKMISSITSATSQVDPAKAQAIMDKAVKAGVVDETQTETIQNKIDAHAVQYYGTRDAAEITSNRIQSDPTTFDRNPQGTMVQMMADAEAKANERYPVDAAHPENAIRHDQFLKQLENNIQGTAATLQKTYKDQTDATKKTVLDLTEQKLPNGVAPVTRAELNLINPNAQNYIDEAIRRDPTFAARLDNKLSTNNSVDNNIRPEALADQQKIWAGKTTAEKMQTDPADLFKKGLINNKLREQMYSDQNKIKSQAVNTFNADGIIGRHGAVLNEAGIFASKTDAGANEKMQWFRGALVSELQRVQGATGVPVKGPQEDQIVNDLLREISTGKKGFFGGDITKPKYEAISTDAPDYVKNFKMPDGSPIGKTARKDMTTGNWQVWQNGKLYNIVAPKE